MRTIRHLFRVVACCAALTALPALAALPDPVRFANAVELRDTRTVRGWLDEGLSPHFLGSRIGSGLMIAAWDGNIPMMELFLSRGADVNQANRIGEQALLLAAWNGHMDAVKWLLDHGAAINRSGKQWSALHYAVFAGHKAIARFLIERGADVNGQAPNQASVLMMAAREGQEELARNLLDAGANPNAVNDRGETALVWAMRQRNLNIAKMVSSAAEFAQATTAPPESFGPPSRSVPPPTEIAEIMNSMRIAELQGLPVDDLRRALFDAVEASRRESPPAPAKPATPRGRPKALLITAKRNQPGSEQARLVYDSAPTESTAATPRKTASVQRATAADVSEMLRRLREAEAQGKATKEMREALYDAVIGVKR
jgi:uncharacterized protein